MRDAMQRSIPSTKNSSSISVPHKMHTLDWDYISEGGKHAIYAYNPKESNPEDNRFQGEILRIEKALFQHDDAASVLISIPIQSSRTESQMRIMQLLFNQSGKQIYVDPPVEIELHPSFLEGLRQRAIESGRIPHSRRLDWNIERCSHKEGTCAKEVSAMASLLPNYRCCKSIHPKHGTTTKSISVEIKPKAGYLATSPLVHPNHDVKYQISKFQILQQLNYDGVVSKGWNKGTGLGEKSRYDPLDLFSCNGVMIRQAIEALFGCPQNNLKIFCDDDMLYGHDGQGRHPTSTRSAVTETNKYSQALEAILDGDLQNPQESKGILECELVEILSGVLLQDPFLPLLLDLQKRFDVLDADGAVLVYNRLVELCDGSKKKAEDLIDADLQLSDSTECTDLLNYLSSWTSPPNDESRQSWYNRGKELVEQLSAKDCIGLLQNWLISLTLCDISFFVIISKVNDGDLADADCQHPLVQTKAGQLLQYEIKVVDYDYKPGKKLRNREQSESKIALFAG